MYANYSNGITNLACSVLKYFGAAYTHDTLKYMDNLLQYPYNNVVVMLFDGMGVDTLRYHLPQDSFLRRHLIAEYSSVFPPTTTAATTSLESGLMPVEHGWLGWSLYFSEIDKIVNIFPNTEKDTWENAAEYNVAQRYLPYKSIFEKINEAGYAKAYSVSKFGTNKIRTQDELYSEITRLCKQNGKKYIYSYWEEPDSTMHFKGCYDDSISDILHTIDKKVEKMCDGLKDTLVIVTADHGHCDLENLILSDYPNIVKMLKRPISIEARAIGFHVKDEYLLQFPVEFHETFHDDFLLLSHKQILEQQIFGNGVPHQKFFDFVGDYMAIAIADKGIVNSNMSNKFKSNHAGMTEKEMVIPFIAIEAK